MGCHRHLDRGVHYRINYPSHTLTPFPLAPAALHPFPNPLAAAGRLPFTCPFHNPFPLDDGIPTCPYWPLNPSALSVQPFGIAPGNYRVHGNGSASRRDGDVRGKLRQVRLGCPVRYLRNRDAVADVCEKCVEYVCGQACLRLKFVGKC